MALGANACPVIRSIQGSGRSAIRRDEGLLRLCLPELREILIDGHRGTNGGLRLDGNSLLETPKLQTLVLDAPGTVTFTPDCFARSTPLTAIKLRKCGLTSIPSALTALCGSLTLLSLPLNDRLQLADDDTKVLLSLRKLRKLHLQKSSLRTAFKDGDTAVAAAVKAHLHHEPALWSQRSLQHLVQLPVAFLLQHGHVPELKV